MVEMEDVDMVLGDDAAKARAPRGIAGLLLKVRIFALFPIWDALVFPLRELADVGELDEIQMVRLSPREATLIPTPS